MDLDFYKLQTAGNDLILINYEGKEFPDDLQLQKLSGRLCQRDYGIGGNGLIAIRSLGSDGIKAVFIDPLGNIPESPSDAALCISRYVFDSGLAGKSDFVIEINNIKHNIGLIDSNNFRLSIGTPMDENGIELIEEPDREYIKNVSAAGSVIPVCEVHLKKHGIVVFTEDYDGSTLKEKADKLLKSVHIDDSKKLIFATVFSRDELRVHIRNRKCDDFSSSCAIAAAAAVVNGFLDREASISHKRGEYFFQWLHPSNEIFLTGSADYIFSGSIFVDI